MIRKRQYNGTLEQSEYEAASEDGNKREFERIIVF